MPSFFNSIYTLTKIGLVGLLAAAQVGSFSTAPTVSTTPATQIEQAQQSIEDRQPQSVTVVDLAPFKTSVAVHTIAPELTIQELIQKVSREYDLDPNLALAVAKCESRFNQYNKAGEVLRGEANHYDVGVFQINEQFHLEKSRTLGFDIYTPKGNVEYAIWLMKAYGRAPWVWSKKCWNV